MFGDASCSSAHTEGRSCHPPSGRATTDDRSRARLPSATTFESLMPTCCSCPCRCRTTGEHGNVCCRGYMCNRVPTNSGSFVTGFCHQTLPMKRFETWTREIQVRRHTITSLGHGRSLPSWTRRLHRRRGWSAIVPGLTFCKRLHTRGDLRTFRGKISSRCDGSNWAAPHRFSPDTRRVGRAPARAPTI